MPSGVPCLFWRAAGTWFHPGRPLSCTTTIESWRDSTRGAGDWQGEVAMGYQGKPGGLNRYDERGVVEAHGHRVFVNKEIAMHQATVWVGLIAMSFVGACAKPVQKEAACCPANAADSQVVDAVKSDSEWQHDETVATLKAVEAELSLDVDGKRARFEAAKKMKPEEIPELVERLKMESTEYENKEEAMARVQELLKELIESYERDYREAEAQLEKVKARRILAEKEQKSAASAPDCDSNTQVHYAEKSKELGSTIATLKAVEMELAIDTDGKRAQFEAVMDKNPEDMPVTPEIEARLNAEGRAKRTGEERVAAILKYQSEKIERNRREYLEALEQLTKVKERRILAESERRNLDAKQYRRENQSKG